MNKIKLLIFSKKDDNRGCLVPIESHKDVPFNIERIFYIKNMDNYPRGFHSHKLTIQVLVPLAGSFTIELTDGIKTENYHLNHDNMGLLVPRNIWLKMQDFSTDCIILVICSYRYDENEYIRNFGDFIKHNSNLKKDQEIPLFSLKQQTYELRFEVQKKFNQLLEINQFVLGTELVDFEKNFSEYNNSKYCVGISNGTSAMVSALKALNLKPEDEVIIQSNSYIAGALAIELAGLKIKIVDIDELTLNLDLDQLEANLTEKTKAVLIVYLYGTCPDMDRLMTMKDKYGFFLIEDAAQAHGSLYGSKKLGTFGEIGCFSFYPSKNLGAYGEGGCIITNNSDYDTYIRKYRNYGSIERYQWEIKGGNERMHNLQAGILKIKLNYLDEWNTKRRALAKIYDRELLKINQVQILQLNANLICNYHLYVVLVSERSQLMTFLKNNQIDTGIHYPNTFYKSTAFTELNHLNFKADLFKDKLLSLPMYPELSEEEVIKVCFYINEFYAIKC